MVVPAGPHLVLDGADPTPQRYRGRAPCPLGRVAVDVVPGAALERDREDVHGAVVERLAAGGGVELLRVVGAAADYVVGVATPASDQAS